MQNNQTISRQQSLAAVSEKLLAREGQIRPIVEDSGVDFSTFRANVVQLLRTRPDVLDCTVESIVNACIEGAHDGLRLDGKEATIAPRRVKVCKKPERWEIQATYIPMAHGLVQQILRSGNRVTALEVEVAHELDDFAVSRGTNPEIHHILNMTTANPGKIIAAYAIATMDTGEKIVEVLRMHDLAQIRASAEQDYVWKAWEGEMDKKSAIRRIRKRLPLGHSRIIDVEATRLFPQMQREDALPDLSSAPARPTRASLADRSGASAGVAFDIDDDGVVLEGSQRRDETRAAKAVDAPAEQQKPAAEEQDTDLPGDEGEWSAWALDVGKRLAGAKDAAAVDAIARDEQARLAAASEDRRNWVNGLIADRRTDFAVGDA